MRTLRIGCAIAALCAATPAHAAERFETSYSAGERDASNHYMGGTELRNLVTHGGKLYAGDGYWEDRPGAEGLQGAQILVLDGREARWRVEQDFDERLPDGRKRNLAISALLSATFTTDGAGAALPRPVPMLIASAWDLTGTSRIFSRDETGAWSAFTLSADRPQPDFLPQIRSLAFHRDRKTGADLVLAGSDPHGIFSASYTAGGLRWNVRPELDIAAAANANFPGLGRRLRVSSFAEADGVLYAAVGQQIFARADGREPVWRLVYTNPAPHYSQSGLRGLTAIPNPAGGGDVLIAAVEGNASRIVRFDPRTGKEATDLDLGALLDAAWGTRVSYVIAAYNDMAKVGDALLLGIEAFIPPSAPKPPGHVVLDVVHGLEGGGWYLVRHADGHYDLHEIDGAGRPLVAVRAIAGSPFAAADAVFFAGYDANGTPAHDTAWVKRASTDAALGRR